MPKNPYPDEEVAEEQPARKSQQVVRYTFKSPQLPPISPVPSEEYGWYGVYFTVAANRQKYILSKIEKWFEGREEIILVDHGRSEKQNMAYVLMEWENCEIDPLFLAILRDEEMVVDFSIHFRALEDYQ